MDKMLFQGDSRLPDGMAVYPKKTAARICLGYALAGWMWIVWSDKAVAVFTQNIEMMVILNSIKGSLFIFLTASILYFLVYSQLQQVGSAQSQYVQSVQALESAHEELTASDEELRQQYDELTIKTNLLEEKDNEMWSLFENMHDAFAVHEIILDAKGTPIDYQFLLVNPAYELLMERTSQELIGHSALEIFPEMDREYIETCGEVAISRNTRKINIFSKLLKKYLSVSLYSPKHGQFVILAMDTTEEKTHEQTVERLAYYDGLTGLPNRVKLTAVLNRELEIKPESPPSGTLLYIDMDDLKMVNDSYGHSYGDAMIITAAMHLVSIAEPDSLVARVGGDEFIVLIPGKTDPDKVERMASEFVETLSREYEVRGLRFQASASIGIAMYPQDGKTTEEILRNADAALYEAKRSGKRCWRFFQQSMQETAFGNMQLINGLRNALANHELEVYYQPQISLDDGSVIAFEALLRWHSPQHGNVSPAQFIPLAEKSHLIESIGMWVVQEACRFSRKLGNAGYSGVRIAVNVSPRQLVATGFIQSIQASCTETELAATCLEIEVTENIFIESMEDSVKKLTELRALGVHLSLDDFGTGYSSLTYLRSLPVQTVKIDKTFIDLIATDSEQVALIASIIDMVHALGMSVVAEGVETSEQLERLIQLGCDTIQGYLVSKAVPELAAIELLKDRTWPDRMKQKAH